MKLLNNTGDMVIGFEGVVNRPRWFMRLNHYQIQQTIKEMAYKDFLQTQYWEVIAYVAKEASNWRCVLCDSRTRLEAHHRSYNRHGLEHLYWNEMISCLCHECHSKHHNKE